LEGGSISQCEEKLRVSMCVSHSEWLPRWSCLDLQMQKHRE